MPVLWRHSVRLRPYSLHPAPRLAGGSIGEQIGYSFPTTAREKGGDREGSFLRRIFSFLAALLPILTIPASTRAASDGQLAEMLLAAAPTVQEVRKATGLEGWWPEPGEFMGRLDPATGLRTLILQSYRLSEPGTRERVMVAISAYVSREAAAARFIDMEPQDNRNYGPAQNESHQGHEQMRLHASQRPRGVSLRLQEGRYILRVTHWSDGPMMGLAHLSQLAHASIERLMEFDLEKRPLPAQPPLAVHLPEETEFLGKSLGTAAGPLEWASFDRAEGENIPDPDLKAHLSKHMRPPVVTMRRWPLLKAAGGQVVQALLFRFDENRAAAKFLSLDKENRSPERLNPEPPSLRALAFIERPSGERGSRMTLSFVSGRSVAQLTCGAPYASTHVTSDCEAALLDLADRLVPVLKN